MGVMTSLANSIVLRIVADFPALSLNHYDHSAAAIFKDDAILYMICAGRHNQSKIGFRQAALAGILILGDGPAKEFWDNILVGFSCAPD